MTCPEHAEGNPTSSASWEMTPKIPRQLQDLFNGFDNCDRCRREANPLKHILGGGLFKNPKYLFLFINPTRQNISSHEKYGGNRRYPFIGVRSFWKLMAGVGIIEDDIIKDIYAFGWRIEHEKIIEENLRKKSVYITNLVKCAQSHPNNPSSEIISEELKSLGEEIKIINPKYIVTFGKLPTKVMTGLDLKLADYLGAIETNDYVPLKSVDIAGRQFNVLPCYFPVGRGNRTGAIRMLRFITDNF